MRYESATSVPNIFKRWFCIYFSTLLVYDVTLTLCSLAHICVDDSGERWRTGYECNGSLSIYLYIYMGGGRPLAFLKQIQRHRTLNTNAFCLLPPWASGHEQFFFYAYRVRLQWAIFLIRSVCSGMCTWMAHPSMPSTNAVVAAAATECKNTDEQKELQQQKNTMDLQQRHTERDKREWDNLAGIKGYRPLDKAFNPIQRRYYTTPWPSVQPFHRIVPQRSPGLHDERKARVFSDYIIFFLLFLLIFFTLSTRFGVCCVCCYGSSSSSSYNW